jgi:putative acetyltransferase
MAEPTAATGPLIVRRERLDDAAPIRRVVAAAFTGVAHAAASVEPDHAPGEATLVTWLREDPSWLPRLSLVAEQDGQVVGHVVCTRSRVDGSPTLGLGPLSVQPERQRSGVGTALMHAVLGAADALDEPLVGLVGDPAYYGRFGFKPSGEYAIAPSDPAWAEYFQVRTLTAYAGAAGTFRFAAPFDRLA